MRHAVRSEKNRIDHVLRPKGPVDKSTNEPLLYARNVEAIRRKEALNASHCVRGYST